MKPSLLLLGVLAAGCFQSLSASPIVIHGTGEFGTGIDSNYKITSSTDPSIRPEADAVAMAGAIWANALAGSRWINPTGNSGDNFSGTYSYTYTTKFDLTGLDPLTAVLSGSLMADDQVKILLNGSPVSNFFGTYTQAAQFTIGSNASAGFTAGLNTLSFEVLNSGSGPTGLDVQLSGTAASAVPEPGALGLVAGTGSLLVALGMIRRRRAKKSEDAVTAAASSH